MEDRAQANVMFNAIAIPLPRNRRPIPRAKYTHGKLIATNNNF